LHKTRLYEPQETLFRRNFAHGAVNSIWQKSALRVVERWNAEQSALWSPTIRCAVVAGTPWLDVYCPGCRTSPGDRYPHLGPPPARFGRQPCARLAVLLVSRQRAYAGITGLHAVPPAARWSKSMPIEFMHGRPLSPEELDMIRRQIEEGFDNITEVDDEIRGIVARNWPYLLEKLPPGRHEGGWV
jgi:hypothetical protein